MQEQQLRHHLPTGSAASHHPHHHPHIPMTHKRPTWFVPPNHIAIRLLCHVSRVGGLIGKSGSIIRQLQQDTSAKIRVEHLPGSLAFNPAEVHRVILIIGSVSVSKKMSLHASDNNVEEVEVSAVQEGAVRVFERVIELAADSEGGEGVEVEVEGIVSCRMLVERDQVGSLIGKGGKIIQMLVKETGCRIKVLTKERLPACALPDDQIVEIEGDIKAIKKGLIAVCRCLQDYSLLVSRNMNGGRSFESVMQEPSHMGRVDRSSVVQPKSASYNGFSSGTQCTFEESDMNESRRSLRQVIFNILCPNDSVGGVIGKGGSIVREIKTETGATISVGPSFPDCPERLITITSLENPGSRNSPAQRALTLVFSRLVAATPVNDSTRALISARLVVPSNEVGCLLGKGGFIISEMRKATGAALQVIYDQLPKCTAGNVEIVQITAGALANVQNAIYSVTTRLRENLSTRTPNGTSHSSASSFLHKNSPYTGARGHHSTQRQPTHSVPNDSNQHSSLSHHMDRLKLGQASGHPAQTVPRGSQMSNGGAGNGSGSRSAVLMSSTLEILVPDNIINAIYGENGSNLSHMRKISGAKVAVHAPRNGSTGSIIVISGSPEQTQTAQTLLQAFILEDKTDK